MNATVPRLVLSILSLDLPVRASRERLLEMTGRYREAESLAVGLVKALDAGAEAVCAVPSAPLRGALTALKKPLPVLARLPLTPPALDLREDHWMMREPRERGDSGFGLEGAAQRVALLPAAITGDVSARVAARIDHESSAWPARSRAGLLLCAPVTDLVLASGHARALDRLLRHGRSRFGLAGLETRNPGWLLARLHEWGLEPDFVMAPIDPLGSAMTPDAAFTLKQLQRGGQRVLASEVRGGGPTALDRGAAYALQQGAWGLAADLVELSDLSADLRGLAALLADQSRQARAEAK